MSQEQQLATTQEPSVAVMLQSMLQGVQQGQITPESVEVLKGMMDLYERNEKRQAEKEFAAALTDLQGETIRVQATKQVDVKNGVPRYVFAAYEDIMKVVQPMLTKHGFSITFDTEVGDQRLTSICTLTHKSGHSRSNKFAVRYGKPPGSSDAQGDMSTKSYAKRGALCDALNISIEKDDDARMEGDFITSEQADSLRRRVAATDSDEQKFLAFADADSYQNIRASRFDSLDEFLRRKEAKKQNPRTGVRNDSGEFEWKGE